MQTAVVTVPLQPPLVGCSLAAAAPSGRRPPPSAADCGCQMTSAIRRQQRRQRRQQLVLCPGTAACKAPAAAPRHCLPAQPALEG